MSTQIRPAPVRKSIFVNAPVECAFDVFANGMSRWWPKTHNICPAELDRAIVEPGQDGRWYERDVNGTECLIGKVAVWDPPSRLVLVWQLTPEFTYDPDLVTEVEVLFTPEGDGTRVDLEHRHLERMGERAETMRQQIDAPEGWGRLLQLFAETAAE